MSGIEQILTQLLDSVKEIRQEQTGLKSGLEEFKYQTNRQLQELRGIKSSLVIIAEENQRTSQSLSISRTISEPVVKGNPDSLVTNAGLYPQRVVLTSKCLFNLTISLPWPIWNKACEPCMGCIRSKCTRASGCFSTSRLPKASVIFCCNTTAMLLALMVEATAYIVPSLLLLARCLLRIDPITLSLRRQFPFFLSLHGVTLQRLYQWIHGAI